jgi:ABC-type oligopeptide transport system substrate-binding subunit
MRKLLAGLVAGRLVWVASSPLWAAHGYALWGDLKYPPGFAHFDYVNPQLRPRAASCAW